MVEAAGADLIHLDVMDGRFVPNITIGLPIVESIRKHTALPLDCHLMIEEPSKFSIAFVEAGANWVSVHQEADPNLHRTLYGIRKAGAKAGVVLNPATPVECLIDLFDDVDFILLMSVNPGFGGQKFILQTFNKIQRLNKLRTDHKKSFLIEVDGGINADNAKQLCRDGADVLVSGDFIFKSKAPALSIAALKQT